MKFEMISALIGCLLLVSTNAMKDDDVSSFFLKAPKSVPRAGRSAPESYDGFFLKASKSVPRVGRRNGNEPYSIENEYQNWLKTNAEGEEKYPWMKQSAADVNWEDSVAADYPYEYETSGKQNAILSHRSRRYNMD